LAILVVGGAGYIGSHVARVLRRHGYEAILYDNLCAGHAFLAHGFELIVADIADSNQLTKVMGRVDAVMHFAAFASVGESVQNPRIYFKNNAEGGLNLLNTALDAGVRKIYFFLDLRGVWSARESAHYGRYAAAAGESVWDFEAFLRECAGSL